MTATVRATKVKVTWDDIMARRAVDEGSQDGLTRAAEIILEASNQIAPLDQGGLTGSGAVDFDLDAKTASVYYDTVYAAKLHQNPKYNFQNGRRGKYLQTATRQARTRVLDAVGEGLKLKFRGRTSSV